MCTTDGFTAEGATLGALGVASNGPGTVIFVGLSRYSMETLENVFEEKCCDDEDSSRETGLLDFVGTCQNMTHVCSSARVEYLPYD